MNTHHPHPASMTPGPYKAEVQTQGDAHNEWTGNALTFHTPEDAKYYAMDLYSRWTAVKRWRVVHVDPMTGDIKVVASMIE